MSESERARVGQALDVIRDALAPYVDAAMAGAYGPAWDQVVARDNAKRRPDGREFPVSKRDLVVLLQVIIHRRIEPWSRVANYPRIRAFASEVLSLRHLHHHGDDCIGEYSRLLDTGMRLLSLLELAVPPGLHPDVTAEPEPSGASAAVEPHPPAPTDLIDAELSRLGEPGGQLADILSRAFTLSSTLDAEMRDAITTHDPETDPDAVRRVWEEAFTRAGVQVVELMDEVNQFEAERKGPGDSLLVVLVLWVRCELSDGLLGQLALLHASDRRLEAVTELAQRVKELLGDRGEDAAAVGGHVLEFPAVDEQMAVVDRIQGFVSGHSQRWDELVRVASSLDETSPLANFVIARANLQLAEASKDAEGGWTGEALPFVRDAVARLRLAAGWEPGSVCETALVSALRLEGEICNDLGRPDEAVQAFTRADEIIDRYPAADPSLRM